MKDNFEQVDNFIRRVRKVFIESLKRPEDSQTIGTVLEMFGKYRRALKLMIEGDNFLVISSKEAYWSVIYQTIRAKQIASGQWNEEDERLFQEAINQKIISGRSKT